LKLVNLEKLLLKCSEYGKIAFGSVHKTEIGIRINEKEVI